MNAVVLWLVLGIAQAGTPATGEICIASQATAFAEQTTDSLRAAWSIRQAVEGFEETLHTVHDERDCGPQTVLLVRLDEDGAVWLQPTHPADAPSWRDNVAGLEPDTRGQALAHSVAIALEMLAEQRARVMSAQPVPEADGPDPELIPEDPIFALPSSWKFGVAAGAQIWTGTPTQKVRIGADMLVLATHRPTGFVAGLAASWLPPADVDGPIPAETWTASGAMLAGWQTPDGNRLGGRLSGGVGLEWRGLDTRPPTRVDTVQLVGTAPFFVAEATLSWSLVSGLEAELGLTTRLYPTGTRHTLGGVVISDAVSVGAAATARLRWWFY